MFRLVIKDFYFLQKKMLFIIPFYIIMLLFLKFLKMTTVAETTACLVVTCIIGILLIAQNSFGFDEKVHFEAFVCTLPLTQNQIVASKYLVCLTASVFSMLCMFVLGYLAVLTGLAGTTAMVIGPTTFFVWVFVTAVFSAIILPILFKKGYMKTRMQIIILAIVIVFVAPMLANQYNKLPTEALSNGLLGISTTLWWLILLAVAAVAAFISFRKSLQIFQQKEL